MARGTVGFWVAFMPLSVNGAGGVAPEMPFRPTAMPPFTYYFFFFFFFFVSLSTTICLPDHAMENLARADSIATADLPASAPQRQLLICRTTFAMVDAWLRAASR